MLLGLVGIYRTMLQQSPIGLDSRDRPGPLDVNEPINHEGRRAELWGPAGDHTSRALPHDGGVPARPARCITCFDVQERSTPLSWGQGVAGSNPAVPTGRGLRGSLGGSGRAKRGAKAVLADRSARRRLQRGHRGVARRRGPNRGWQGRSRPLPLRGRSPRSMLAMRRRPRRAVLPHADGDPGHLGGPPGCARDAHDRRARRAIWIDQPHPDSQGGLVVSARVALGLRACAGLAGPASSGRALRRPWSGGTRRCAG